MGEQILERPSGHRAISISRVHVWLPVVVLNCEGKNAKSEVSIQAYDWYFLGFFACVKVNDHILWDLAVAGIWKQWAQERTGILSCAHYFQAMWDLKCTERDDEIGKSSKASIKSRKSINTEEAMLTVIVLRNGPDGDKNDSNNGNQHVGMQKRC